MTDLITDPKEVQQELDTLLAPLDALSKDVRTAVQSLDRDSAMRLVELYYRLQEHRIALGNQMSSLVKDDRPAQVVSYYFEQISGLEKKLPTLLGNWGKLQPGGDWALSQKGIGPVLVAALGAHINIERCNTAGKIWRFAGLDPSITWGKGQKRPYNARLKVICWKIGDSFVKVSGRDNAFYGQLYRQRKTYEVERNESGGNAECAAQTLETRNIKDPKTLKTYQAGRLPDGRVDLRARRWVVKLFLSHYQRVAWVEFFGEEPPKPYIITHSNPMGAHTQIIDPPGWDG
jgi:Transposase IS116/IS110/IS902 family